MFTKHINVFKGQGKHGENGNVETKLLTVLEMKKLHRKYIISKNALVWTGPTMRATMTYKIYNTESTFTTELKCKSCQKK